MGKQLRGSAIVMALTCVTALVALGYDHRGEDDGTGFSDGFVTGYGKHCQLRSSRSEARWQDAGYTRAYADGLAMGTKACDNERSSSNAPVVSHAAVAQLGSH